MWKDERDHDEADGAQRDVMVKKEIKDFRPRRQQGKGGSENLLHVCSELGLGDLIEGSESRYILERALEVSVNEGEEDLENEARGMTISVEFIELLLRFLQYGLSSPA